MLPKFLQMLSLRMNVKQVLREIVGWTIGMFFVATGCLARQLRRYDKPGTFLAIVCHDPCERVFVGIVEWLIKHGFSFVTPDELFAIQDGRKQWRPRMVWLSFDDGWLRFKSRIIPIIERYSVKATLFIAPHETERGQVWTNSIMPFVPYEKIREMYACASGDRYAVVDAILAEKTIPRQLMDAQTIRELAHHPLITIENHTFTHLSCSHRPISEVVAEIKEAQGVLSDWTGRTPRMVCYPFGHCSDETDNAVKQLGMIPVRLDPGVSDITRIGAYRNLVCDRHSITENVCRALNAWIAVTIPDKG